MTNHVVTIGRNVGDKPLNEAKWLEFRGKVLSAILRHGFTLLTEAKGSGYWEGSIEDSAIWVFTGDGKTWALTNELSHLAYQFEQEAIAWQEVKDPQLIRP